MLPLPQTPTDITPLIRDFCRDLIGRSGASPVYVPVRPAPAAQLRECFPAVAAFQQEHGGDTRYGWMIAALPGVLLEAIFHAVWAAPDGALLDVTPHAAGHERILFLADLVRRYDGRQVNNRRRAFVASAVFRDYDQACNDEFALLNRGERAEQLTVTLTSTEHAALQNMRARQMAAMMELMRGAQHQHQEPAGIPRRKPGRNEPCPCGSGKKFKKCHGR